MSKKIVTLNEATPTPSEQQRQPLTIQDIQNIGAAYAKLLELKQQSVLTVNTEAEVKGLLEYLSSELIHRADELLACWITVHSEYQPLLHLLARISGRVAGIKPVRKGTLI